MATRAMAPTATISAPSSAGPPTIRIAGTKVHLTDARGACDAIADTVHDHSRAPLAVTSVNLDHVHHAASHVVGAGHGIRHLNLIDGAPIASQVRRLTGADWPRLSGNDLIGDILRRANSERWRVAVVGGSPATRESLHRRVVAQWPGVSLIGHWTPNRAEVASSAASAAIAEKISHTDADLVIVCMGKPLQEDWIDAYGEATGARVLLAFDAVVDFLAGRVSRAPRWVARTRFVKMWRLMLEPRRLAKRYLVEGPPAYLAVRRSSGHQEA
ncbi:WecB/TagA/CpsF family glycosyltransferase [Microbacterium sp. MM2322]|uniref:WecB/TagA/CpsF family glycosyltransferase n=1 Tax=Microbacterium sp. MM2322 TaxID=3157631 RepID=UPI0032D57E83